LEQPVTSLAGYLRDVFTTYPAEIGFASGILLGLIVYAIASSRGRAAGLKAAQARSDKRSTDR
jgi:hypothetical protein